MSFRLLAYGGTIFAEQRRFGSWSVPESALADFYGLVGEHISFGIGALDGGTALIFRQRQNLQNRGGYPYALLLDPGIEIWRRFGWSPSALLLALQADASGQLLLSRPQDIELDVVEQLLHRLSPLPESARTDDAEPSSMHELLAGSLLADRVPGASSAWLGFPARPDPAAMAATLSRGNDWPVFSRTGRGWLVGGSVAHSGVFGVQCVVDDQLPSSDAVLSACREEGRRVLDEWQVVRRAFPQAFDDLHAMPPWCWTTALRDVLARVSIASAFLANEIDDSRYADVAAITRAGGWLEPEIRGAARDALRSGPIGTRSARFLLDEGLSGASELTASQFDAFDREWLAETLMAEGMPPAPLPASAPISPAFHVELWRRVLAAKPREDRIGLLKQAVAQLGTDADYGPLVDAAVPADPTPVEHAQLSRLRTGPLGIALRERLAPLIRRRAQTGDIDPVAYARYVPNAENLLYQDLMATQRSVATIQTTALALLQSLDDSDCVRQLRGFATNRLRPHLQPHVKRRIAERLGEADRDTGAWTPYLKLCELYDGKDLDPPEISEAEKARLRQELAVLLDSESTTPNVRMIALWLGPLPGDTLDRLQRKWTLPHIPMRPAPVPRPSAPPSTASTGTRHERAIDAVLFGADPTPFRHVLTLMRTDGDFRVALLNVLAAESTATDPRRAAHPTPDEVVAFLDAFLTAERPTVIKWLDRSDLLLQTFGPEIARVTRANIRELKIPISLAWDVVEYLQSAPQSLQHWAKTLLGTRAPDFIAEIKALRRGA